MPRLAPILIIDDDQDIRESIGLLLRSEGYGVFEARSGNQALTLLRGGVRPSLILLDLWMPDGDGWYVRAALQELQALRDVPLVIVSGAPSRGAASMGVGLLTKPISLKRLLGFASTYCDRPPC
jgi:CheY-like chemotaxis protein